jgi:hypothetical protein
MAMRGIASGTSQSQSGSSEISGLVRLDFEGCHACQDGQRPGTYFGRMEGAVRE